MGDPKDPMKTASTTVLTVEKPRNGPSGWRRKEPILQYAGKFKQQNAAYFDAYTDCPQQIAAPRHLKCPEGSRHPTKKKENRFNDGNGRQNNFNLPAEETNPSPSAISTPPPLHPHVKPVMTANARVTLAREGETDVDRWIRGKIELPQVDSALPSHLTPIATQTGVRCCYYSIYSRFRPAHVTGCHSAQ